MVWPSWNSSHISSGGTTMAHFQPEAYQVVDDHAVAVAGVSG